MQELLQQPEVIGTIITITSLLALYLINLLSKKFSGKVIDENGEEIVRGIVSRLIRWIVSKIISKKKKESVQKLDGESAEKTGTEGK